MATKRFKWLALLGSALLVTASAAFAQDSGPLIDMLVKKGIVNDQEAENLRAELTRDFVTSSSAGKLDLSPAITKYRIAADLRVRYQYDNEQANPAGTANNMDRSRYRYRFRLGTTANLGPKWSAGIRLESNGGATSTNNDFGSGTDNFSKSTDGVNLGQVFVQYNNSGILGASAVDIRVGKFAHKFFGPGVNGFWIDSDINFEGLAEELTYTLGSTWSLNLRAGQFMLNSNSSAGSSVNDPSVLHIVQAEVGNKMFKIAPTFVAFTAPSAHDSGAPLSAVQANDTNVYTDLATFLFPMEFSSSLLDKPLAIYATAGFNLYGEDRARRLASTESVDDDAMIGNLGLRFGGNKLAKEYQVTAEYRYVGNGSYSSLLLDSDFNGGYLNASGVIVSGSYNFTDAINTTVTYFNSFNIEATRPAGGSTNRGNGFGRAQVLQIDLSAKF